MARREGIFYLYLAPFALLVGLFGLWPIAQSVKIAFTDSYTALSPNPVWVGLENFAGCAVISSHDRWFLDRIATHIMAFEGDSKVTWFEGNYSEYEADRKKRLGKEADQPHRIRYRKLTR